MLRIALLLGLSVVLVACGQRGLDRRDVQTFIDSADQAARKRFAPAICALRGKNFKHSVRFHADGARAPSEFTIERKLYCLQAGQFAQLWQYQLERKSMDIELSADRKTARVLANYVEKMPFYDPNTVYRSKDSYEDVQVLETRDDSTVGIEDGDIVFLSTNSETHQTLVPKSQMPLPYDWRCEGRREP